VQTDFILSSVNVCLENQQICRPSADILCGRPTRAAQLQH